MKALIFLGLLASATAHAEDCDSIGQKATRATDVFNRGVDQFNAAKVLDQPNEAAALASALRRKRIGLETMISGHKQYISGIRAISAAAERCNWTFNGDLNQQVRETRGKIRETEKDLAKLKKMQAGFRKTLKKQQTVMKHMGFYTGKIDGAWGPGSRRSQKKFAKYLNADAKRAVGVMNNFNEDLSCLRETTRCMGFFDGNRISNLEFKYFLELKLLARAYRHLHPQDFAAAVEYACKVRDEVPTQLNIYKAALSEDAQKFHFSLVVAHHICEQHFDSLEMKMPADLILKLQANQDTVVPWPVPQARAKTPDEPAPTEAATDPKPDPTIKRTSNTWPPEGDILLSMGDVHFMAKIEVRDGKVRLFHPQMDVSGKVKKTLTLTGTLGGDAVMMRIKQDLSVEIFGETDEKAKLVRY